jgi:hypothetical protein
MQSLSTVLAVVLASFSASFSAYAQTQPLPAEAPPPAYGTAGAPSTSLRVRPVLGVAISVAKPLGDFGNAANVGFEATARGGAEMVIGPGISVTPDLEVNFVRFGASDLAQRAGLDSAYALGFMLGGRFGYEFPSFVTPYMDLHFGYFHNSASGAACDAGANCSSDKFAMEFGFGGDFWLTDTLGLGPFLKFNFDFTDVVSSNWFGFGASLTLRL